MEYQIERVELTQQPAAVVRGEVPVEGIAAFLGGAFGEVMGLLGSQGLAPSGPPFARYEPSPAGFRIEAGFPVAGEIAPVGRVEATDLPGGPAVRVLHLGAYGEVAAAYQAAQDWLTANGWKVAGNPWESYLDGPEVPEPRTLVHVPCRPAGDPA